MKILAAGAHADDVELGCGGSLLKWASEGHEILIFVATKSGYSGTDGNSIRNSEDARREAERSAAQIGAELIIENFECFELEFAEPLNAALLSVGNDYKPDLMLTHWDGDTHPDHKALAQASMHVCRRVPSLLMYASNWYQGSDNFDGRHRIDISKYLEGKLELIRMFESEIERTGDDWLEFVRDEAAVQGKIAGVEFAETFKANKFLAP